MTDDCEPFPWGAALVGVVIVALEVGLPLGVIAAVLVNLLF